MRMDRWNSLDFVESVGELGVDREWAGTQALIGS